MTQIFANGMVNHNVSDGSIVNISSVSAYKKFEGYAAYSMSKAALTSFTKTTALEYGKHGIRSNAIAPGLILTPMAKRLPALDMDKISQLTALEKLGTPEGKLEVFLLNHR